jgi:hypothetical protein
LSSLLGGWLGADGKWMSVCGGGCQKNDQSTPIVTETEQLPNRPNFPLSSRPQGSDGSGGRCLTARQKNLRCQIKALPWLKMIE